MRNTFVLGLAIFVLVGCGSSSSGDGGGAAPPAGSAGSGGESATGGSGGSSAGGSATGGSSAGGESSGGSGGTSAGGTSSGGSSSGGAANGGSSSAGAAGAETGGSGGSAMLEMCPAFTPCGGDVVGTWNFQSGCIDITGLDSCATATGHGTISGTGTLTLNADGTSSTMTNVETMVTLNLPKSCLGGQPCSALNQPPSQTATDAGDHCVMMADQTKMDATMDMYTLSGDTITIKKSDGTMQTWQYCVTGNTLVMSVSDGKNTQSITATK